MFLIIAQCKELVSLMGAEMQKLLNHVGGGRARNSDGFVCLYQIPLKKYMYTLQVIAKNQISKDAYTF